ncbi:DUF1217 domain-containing protein [Roseomonas haemaphysalidis]|uniref:DUF1217 domain-containing protein n=1 Tax=Roseomonas haemaphysalidis TaxID=2768162 RepID=A0ABS3KSW6_9PROT|nr:DUF1217 domain-containing protein [Roseomonas haemaphysalidis]MBO1080509.1 DUF1217 domain-containing protein [Roseomonas haemaphysalidis]
MSIGAINLGLPAGVAGWKMLQGKSVGDFKAFSKDALLQRDIAYLREKLPQKATAKDLLADRRLQEIVLKAYGLDAQVGMDALMRKVLDSNPTDTGSVAARMVDARYQKIAAALNYGGLVIPEISAVPSGATVVVEGIGKGETFASFSGSFGGIKVDGVSLDGLGSRQGVAAALQAAFRKADGKSSNISVTTLGGQLVFSDARGRGTAVDFAFKADPGSTARASLQATNTGSIAVAAIGGPKVKDGTTVEAVVSLYTQARFEESLGESSDTLRKAVYAKRTLPGVTSWYSVIADRNLAGVVQQVLGLPDSFGRLDVDQQKATLERRMSLSDFKDGTKLSKLLDRYVAQSSVAEAQALASSGAGLAGLVQPVPWGGDSFSGSSAAALFSIMGG